MENLQTPLIEDGQSVLPILESQGSSSEIASTPESDAVFIFTTVADDGTLIMLPPVGDTVRAALVWLKDLVQVVGTEQVTGMVMVGLSHIAAALDQISRERIGIAMEAEHLADNLRRVTFSYIPNVDDSKDSIPQHTEWRGGTIVTFVEDDSLPTNGRVHRTARSWRGILVSLLGERIAVLASNEPQLLTFSADITQKSSPRTTQLSPVVRFKNDNINRAAVRAFSIAATWKPVASLAHGTEQMYKGLQIAIGLPESDVTQRIWSSLSKGGARMVKAHYALWARWYEDGGEAGDYVSVNVNQFCADIGYTKHHKGGFRREHKQEAMNLLEALTMMQISAEYQAPGASDGKRLRGGLWARGMIGEQKEPGEDGGTPTWEAVAFSFAPGPWFTHPAWARHNNFIGKLGIGLLQLDNREEWAIIIGGYLGTLMRTNAYQALRVRASTILHRTGLGQSDDLRRRSGQMLQKFENAMDQLVSVNVIISWTWPDVETTELENLDDADAIAEYYAEENLPKSDWRNQIVEIVLPFEQDETRLLEARGKAKKASAHRLTKNAREKNL